jgi:hypothetical protein
MTENGSRSDRVAALAVRLRLVQIDFADQGDDVRRGYLVEELQRAIASVVPSERRAFLDELQARFPTWDGGGGDTSPAASAPGSATERQLRDPMFLIGKLLEIRATLSEPQRRAVTEQLQQAGFLGTAATGLPAIASSELAGKLGLAPRDEIDSQRVLELLTQLVDIFCSLDRVIWMTWQKIAPQSTLRCPGVLQPIMARFVTGSPMVSRQQMIDDTNMLRQLVAALIGAIAQTGQFAVEHFRSTSPDEIRMLVGSVMLNADSRYWRKYVELCEVNDVNAVDDAMRRAIADFAERLIRGRRLGP